MTQKDLVSINSTVLFDAERQKNKVELKTVVAEKAKKSMLKAENLLEVEIPAENGSKDLYTQKKGIKIAKDGHTVIGKTVNKSSKSNKDIEKE